MGIKIACFLDDGLGTARKLPVARSESKLVRSSLISAGFLINKEKSQWEPVHDVTWLGIKFTSTENVFTIPNDRAESLQKEIDLVIHQLPYTSARKLAKVCGKIISTKFVLGNIVQLKTRRLYHVI